MLLASLRSFQNGAIREHKEQCYACREQRNESLSALLGGLERGLVGTLTSIGSITEDRALGNWTSAEFGKLQALPTGGKPVTLWADRDSAWADVAKGIREVAAEGRPQFVMQL